MKVCVVVPVWISAMVTGIVAAVLVAVAVAVGETTAVGVLFAVGVVVAFAVAVAEGVPVPFTVAVGVPVPTVAVALAVGVEAVPVTPPLGVVLGILFKVVRISLMLGFTPDLKLVIVKTVCFCVNV